MYHMCYSYSVCVRVPAAGLNIIPILCSLTHGICLVLERVIYMLKGMRLCSLAHAITQKTCGWTILKQLISCMWRAQPYTMHMHYPHIIYTYNPYSYVIPCMLRDHRVYIAIPTERHSFTRQKDINFYFTGLQSHL